jgi:hypothetical protein
VFSGTANTNDVVHYGFASATPDPGVTRTDFDLVLSTVYLGHQLVNRRTFWTETNVLVSYTFTGPTPFQLTLVGGGEPKDTSHGTVFGYHAEIDRTSLVPCQYGTELNQGGTFVYYLTPGLIDVWLAGVGMPWLAPLFTALWFTSFNAQDLCGSGPPPFPVINLDTLEASAATVLQILKCVAWPNLCRCTPGTPIPTGYPPPSATQPVGWPVVPTINCAESDLCATLLGMQRQLAALQQALNSNLELTTLLQRYGLPFAFINGATHQISASGSFAVSRLVGVKIVVTAAPGGLQQFTGVPSYISDLGWISLVTGEGLMDEVRLTRAEQYWFPRLMPLALSLGIGLREGVTVSVQELEAEP